MLTDRIEYGMAKITVARKKYYFRERVTIDKKSSIAAAIFFDALKLGEIWILAHSGCKSLGSDGSEIDCFKKKFVCQILPHSKSTYEKAKFSSWKSLQFTTTSIKTIKY